MQINPYYYSQYLYERVNRREAFVYLNAHFKTKYGQAAFANVDQDPFADIGLGEPPIRLNFVSKLGNAYLNAHDPERLYLMMPFGEFFAELWRWAPIHEVFTLPNFSKQKEDFSYKGQEEIIYQAFIQSVKEGWITYEGEDFEEYELPEDYTGRTIFGGMETSTNYEHHYNFDFLTQLAHQSYKIEEESPYIYPENFWQHQVETQPIKVVEAFLYTLFIRYYNRVTSALQRDLEIIQQFIPFATATKKAIMQTLDMAPAEVLNALPCYAGYSKVADAKKWLNDLLACLRGRKTLEVLGERR